MGTDRKRSPTIVFGDVFARNQCLKAFKSEKSINILPFAGTDESFEELKNGISRERDISFLISQIGEMSRAQYNSRYASLIWDVPYNRALGYIISNHRYPAPMSAPEIVRTDPITAFINGQASSAGLTRQIPTPFDSIIASTNDLGSIDNFLAAMQIPGDRNAWTIETSESQTLLKALEDAGFYRNQELDINGWLYVKGPGDKSIGKEIKLKSHGGIVLETGSLTISNNIICDSQIHLLNLVTMSGDIILSESLAGRLDASLTANGQVMVKGRAGSPVPEISGNIAMKRIRRGSLNDAMARGVNINYPTKLAALPDTVSNDGSEEPILMYAIDWHPALVE